MQEICPEHDKSVRERSPLAAISSAVVANDAHAREEVDHLALPVSRGGVEHGGHGHVAVAQHPVAGGGGKRLARGSGQGTYTLQR